MSQTILEISTGLEAEMIRLGKTIGTDDLGLVLKLAIASMETLMQSNPAFIDTMKKKARAHDAKHN